MFSFKWNIPRWTFFWTLPCHGRLKNAVKTRLISADQSYWNWRKMWIFQPSYDQRRVKTGIPHINVLSTQCQLSWLNLVGPLVWQSNPLVHVWCMNTWFYYVFIYLKCKIIPINILYNFELNQCLSRVNIIKYSF